MESLKTLTAVRDKLNKLVKQYSGDYRSFRFADDASKILNYVQGALDVLEKREEE